MVSLYSVIATSLGIAIYRGVLSPLLTRYYEWKAGPRVQVARRNWRGIYVPDLGIRRVERMVWSALFAIFALGCAIGWTVMTTPT